MTRQGFRRLFKTSGGGALVELAVALPLLVVVLAGTIDFARVFRLSISLTNAARAGALYGSQGIPQSFPVTGMENAARNSTNVAGVTAVGTRQCECSDNAGNFTATSPANNCSYVCPSGGHIVMTVTVTASKQFNTTMNVIPGLPSVINLSRSATLRVAN
jgi:Flp pilus assembly protein TadG